MHEDENDHGVLCSDRFAAQPNLYAGLHGCNAGQYCHGDR